MCQRRFETRTGRIISPVQLAPDRMSMVIRCDPTPGGEGLPLTVRLTWRARTGRSSRVIASGFEHDYGLRAARPTPGIRLCRLSRASRHRCRRHSERGGKPSRFWSRGGANPHWVVWNQFDRWRASIRRSALESLSQPALGLYLGVIIGERGYLESEVRDQFMVTGTVHLLSISGSHLGLVAMITFMAVRRGLLLLPAYWLLALSRWITPTRAAAVATVAPVTAYACLAGAEVATVRSLLMVLVALMAKWLGYERRMFHALSAAALIIVAHDPQAIYDISFQLSFLSVSAVAWWLAKTEGAGDHNESLRSKPALIGRWIGDAVLMSAVVTVVTLPLVALYFNQFPWVGLLTNLAAVPVMGDLLVPMGLAAVVWQGLVGGAACRVQKRSSGPWTPWSRLCVRSRSCPAPSGTGPRHPSRLSCSFTDVWPRSPSGPIEKPSGGSPEPVSSCSSSGGCGHQGSCSMTIAFASRFWMCRRAIVRCLNYQAVRSC